MVGVRTKLINSLRGIAKSHGIGFGQCGMTKWVAALQECPAALTPITPLGLQFGKVRAPSRSED